MTQSFRFIKVSITITFSILLLTGISCDGWYEFNYFGYVYCHQNLKPIEGVIAELDGNKYYITDSNGFYLLIDEGLCAAGCNSLAIESPSDLHEIHIKYLKDGYKNIDTIIIADSLELNSSESAYLIPPVYLIPDSISD